MLDCVPDPVCQTTSGKMVVELAVDDFLGGRDDRVAYCFVKQALGHIGLGGGLLDDAERAHQRRWHALGADFEIAE